MQLKPQLALLHVADAFEGALQTVPQAPQLDVSVCVSTQEPLQSVVGAEQLVVHAPAAHTWFAPHAAPQAPQLFLSVCVSTHAPLQYVYPALHVSWHWPTEQVALPLGGGLQACPQVPQFWVSDDTLLHAPLHSS